MKSNYILGINSAYHECSAAVIKDGVLVAAVEEERFSGRKHGKTPSVENADELPHRAIEFCLAEARIRWCDLAAVSYSLDPALRNAHACLGTDGSSNAFGHPVGEATFQRSLARVAERVSRLTHAVFLYVPHHDAHAWYAMGSSPCHRAAVLIADGIGEGASISMGVCTRRHLAWDEQYLFPASIGLAWEKVSRLLGMTRYDACKVMALAGLHPGCVEWLTPSLKFDQHGLWVDNRVFDLEHPDDFAGLVALCSKHVGGNASWGLAQRAEVAAAIQEATERVLLGMGHLLRWRSRLDELVYGGGVALNCRANQVLAESNIFRHIYVGPASHDGGTALGAAWSAYTKYFDEPLPIQDFALLHRPGPRPATQTGTTIFRSFNIADSVSEAARWLSEGRVLGWVEGRCEFGPRALGGRSLLASPLPGVKERLNVLKGRLHFEPLAVSVTAANARQLFDIPVSAETLTRSMLVTVRPRPAWIQALKHLIHADGTLRIHVVDEVPVTAYHDLLCCLAAGSSTPVLINTSLNPRGAPMPATATGALTRCLTLGVTHLFISNDMRGYDNVGGMRASIPVMSLLDKGEAPYARLSRNA